ncbi:MAG: ABC transporter substrate-binding protein [Planctomycetota bacterium]
MSWRIVVLSCCVLSGLIGCKRQDSSSTTAPGDEKEQLVIGFSQVGAESAWRTAESKSIKSAADERGIKLIPADAQQKQANQIKSVRSFITQQVDAIVIAPVVETGWEPVLREAQRANIPIFLVDRGIKVSDDSLYVTLIASDFVEEGRMAAQWLAQKMNGQANIVELEGTTGSAPAIDRKKGFHEALADYPGMKIIKSQSADFTRAKGKEVMEAFIKAVGDQIQAVYAHNDDMALGAIQALDEAGLKPGVDVVIISIDAVRAAFEAMIAGQLNATVECNPLLGPLLFETIAKVHKGESVPKYIKQVDQLFDQSVAAEVIDSRQY